MRITKVLRRETMFTREMEKRKENSFFLNGSNISDVLLSIFVFLKLFQIHHWDFKVITFLFAKLVKKAFVELVVQGTYDNVQALFGHDTHLLSPY